MACIFGSIQMCIRVRRRPVIKKMFLRLLAFAVIACAVSFDVAAQSADSCKTFYDYQFPEPFMGLSNCTVSGPYLAVCWVYNYTCSPTPACSCGCGGKGGAPGGGPGGGAGGGPSGGAGGGSGGGKDGGGGPQFVLRQTVF